MKRTLLTLAAAGLLLAAPRFAAAGVDVSIGIGLPFPGIVFGPPVVVGPPVVYAPPPRVVYGPPVYYGRPYGGPVYVQRHPGKHWRKHHRRHHHGHGRYDD